jgi:hypothetical protein
VDFDCGRYYIDVKQPDKYYDAVPGHALGINSYSYDKYVALDKPVYIYFVLNDADVIIDVNSTYTVYEGITNDKAHGLIQKKIYNYPLSNAVAKRMKKNKN